MSEIAKKRQEVSAGSRAPLIPVNGQAFESKDEWIRRARYALTAHPKYHNTEHDGPGKGWRGEHFTALCFDQKGRRVRRGEDFQRAEEDGSFPIWWVWPDQIADLISAGVWGAKIEENEAAQ